MFYYMVTVAMEIHFPLAFLILDLVYLIEILFGVTHLLEVDASVGKSGTKKRKC